MLSLPSNLSDVVHISVYVAFVFQHLYFCDTQYSVAHLSLLSIKKGWVVKLPFLISFFRTTTLTEELGQIQYIFSDKVNIFCVFCFILHMQY